MKDRHSTDFETIHALAVAYAEGVYFARAATFEDMCHERFLMTAVNPDGTMTFWDKAAYLDRVKGREAFPGAASYAIHSIDIAGGEIARVHLWVDVPPRRYEDHLGFVCEGGRWQLMTKVFRTVSGPERNG